MLFLDTEFHASPSGPKLLSLALVSERDEAYFELDRVGLDQALGARPPPFISQQVLPQLGRVPGAAGSYPWIADRIVEWLNLRAGGDVPVHYDFSTDFELLEQLITDASLPLAARLCPTHIGYLLEDPDGSTAAELCWAQVARDRGLERHHALADALALRARFWAVHGL